MTMRILVTTNAAIGHFLPMAATIEALVADGHDVRVACPASFAPFVGRTGFEAIACEEIEVALPAPPGPSADEHERLTWAVTISWPSDCRTWLDSLLRATRDWRPDVVLVEPVEHGGRIVAAMLGVPLVVHGWGFTLPADVEARAAEGIQDLYERVSATRAAPALVADLGPAAVQAPDAGPAQRYLYRPFAVPGDPLPPARTADRRVLVTLGTYANPYAASVIRAAVDAALDNGADVIAVLGNDDRGTRDSFPAHVTALDWVDMPAAMAGCDLAVHHGGAGTSWTALSTGTPAVVLPQSGDQFRNAEIIAAAGAAAVCSSPDAGDIAASIAKALDEPSLAETAASIARANAALPDVAELAADIARLR